jgi:hypothetical protein
MHARAGTHAHSRPTCLTSSWKWMVSKEARTWVDVGMIHGAITRTKSQTPPPWPGPFRRNAGIGTIQQISERTTVASADLGATAVVPSTCRRYRDLERVGRKGMQWLADSVRLRKWGGGRADRLE